MPAWNWRRCIGMVLVQSRIYSRQSGDFRMRIPVLWFWKKKVMMINPVPDWSDASILEREPAKMMRGPRVLGKGLCKAGGISMLSMHFGTLWLEPEVGDSARQWNGLKAANAEHSAAQYVLGKLYQDGVYFNKDMDQAMKWFRSAAELLK